MNKEHLKKALGLVLAVAAGVALYDLVAKPLFNKAKTVMPSTATS